MLKASGLVYVPPISQEIVLDNGLRPHQGFLGSGFVLEPLHRVHSKMDYLAWHDQSFAQLEVLFRRAWGSWPRQTMSEVENANDLERIHYQPFLQKLNYTYTVLNPTHSHVVGCLYITPKRFEEYDAVVEYWIATPYRRAIELTFFVETKTWLEVEWPFTNIYFPGPEPKSPDWGDEARGRDYAIMAGL